MKLKSTRTVIYMVVTDMKNGKINCWYPAKTLKEARAIRKEFMDSSTNNWEYPIVKNEIISLLTLTK